MGISLWTREQVAERILAGENLVVLRNKIIRVPPSWLDAHPGGALAILHFVGRDATDEGRGCGTPRVRRLPFSRPMFDSPLKRSPTLMSP